MALNAVNGGQVAHRAERAAQRRAQGL